MIQTKVGDAFINYLNNRLSIRDGHIKNRPLARGRMRMGERVLCIPEGQSLDFVIEGPGTDVAIVNGPAAEQAMRDRSTWLNVARSGRILTIALYPEEGKLYSQRFRDFLTRSFPNVTWYFPRLKRSLTNESQPHQIILAKAFIKAEALTLTDWATNQIDRFRSVR